MVRTGADLYDTLKIAAEMAVAAGRPITPPDAGEEQRLYVQKSSGAKKLRDVEELRDYFVNNDKGWYARGWTLTCLRFREADLRKPYNVGDKITAEVIVTDITPYLSQIADPQFTRENWKDIIGKANQARRATRSIHQRPCHQGNASYLWHIYRDRANDNPQSALCLAWMAKRKP